MEQSIQFYKMLEMGQRHLFTHLPFLQILLKKETAIAYKDEDADIEACIPVRTPVDSEGIKSRVIKGDKVAAVIHT